jgi:hypothetical protein
MDVTNKHRQNIEVLIDQGTTENLLAALNKIEFGKMEA